MIDFHTHILPNVDDGSKSVEETFELLNEAKIAGFDEVIFTPHYMENHYEMNAAEQDVWLKAISANLHNSDVKLKVHSGNEIYSNERIVYLIQTGRATSINNSNYVLFEFPMNSEPLNMNEIIYNMLSGKIIPVLAHPERYAYVQKSPEMVYELIQKGVLMQCNYGSIVGLYGEKAKKIVKKLLESNMVHFLGSDVHRQKTIYTKIPEAINEIKGIIGEERFEKISTINPKLVLENKKIEIDEPKPITLSLKEKIMLNLKKRG